MSPPALEAKSTARLIALLRDLRTSRGLSERELLRRANLSPGYLQQVVAGSMPTVSRLIALAKALEVPPVTLLEALVEKGDALTPPRPGHSREVLVRAYVEAGVFAPSDLWPPDDWYSVDMPLPSLPPWVPVIGCEVRGRSMDRVYPPGSILACARLIDLDRQPQDGERVIVRRRSNTDDGIELTCKRLGFDGDRAILWPMSTDPDHQQPLVIPFQQDPDAHQVGTDDIVIDAVVVAAIVPEGRHAAGGT
jgi:transcriptional regulator with XRE-family HTH domain